MTLHFESCLTNGGKTIWHSTRARWQVSAEGPEGHLLELKARLETRSKKLMKGYEVVITELEHEPCALKCRR